NSGADTRRCGPTRYLPPAARLYADSGRAARNTRPTRCGTPRSSRRRAGMSWRAGAECRLPRRDRSKSLAAWRPLSADGFERREFRCVGARGALRPGVCLPELLGIEEARMQGATIVGVVDQQALEIIQAAPLDPWRGAFEIVRFLAIELEEGADIFQHLVLARDAREFVRDAHRHAAIAADHNVVAGLDAYHAEILDRRFGAIARAPRYGELDLVRRIAAPAHFLDLDAEAGRILRTETAPFAADARFHRAQRLAVGMAGHQAGLVEIGPDRGQLILARAEHVDALSARHFHGRNVVPVGRIGDGAQFVGRGDAAPHARHDGIGAVLLDIGVDALIDETRAGIVAIFAGPGAQQIVVQRRAAFLAAVGIGPTERVPRIILCLETPCDDLAPHFVMAERGAAAHRRRLGGLLGAAHRLRQNGAHDRGALPARGRSLGVGTHRIEGGKTLGGYGCAD